MLVPAMTFAWWLVSMSAHGHHAHHHGATHDKAAAGAIAELAGDRDTDDGAGVENPYDVQAGKADDTGSSEAAAAGDSNDEANDNGSGERVALKVVTPAIVRAARTYLDLPMGAERSEVIDGQRYVFVLEWHYHPPGFVGGPHGWHKGVTVYGVR